jgi:hypothetical protein
MNLLRTSLIVIFALVVGSSSGSAQVELLPVDHPATQALVRIYEYGGIAEFPREQLPISRGFALQLLQQAAADTLLPLPLRQQAEYYRVELAADDGTTPTSVFIPTGDNSRLIYSDPFAGLPVAVLDYRDTSHGLHLVFEGLADGELRIDPSGDQSALLLQGGFQLRGTLLNHIGFSSRFTNGTIVGDSQLVLRDPRFSHSGKFGVIGIGRDVDFGSGHARVDFDVIALEVGREWVQLGGGVQTSLFAGSVLPSMYDYLRLTARLGRVSFTHLHASLLAGAESLAATGVDAVIPSKYLAAHLISFGPFAGIRGTLGESVVYSRRPFEIGYLNPLNFFKSQEHYLRDRDNSNMYAALSINPADGFFFEGEFLLDDLKFSEIGDGFWGNKTAWRVGVRATAFPLSWTDFGVNYTRLEPYVFSHFDSANAYTHDGVTLAGAGLQPNSEMIEARLRIVPMPNLTVSASVAFVRHGANVTVTTARGDSVVRNVGGDVGRTLYPKTDSSVVEFLDGRLEKATRMRLEAEYEPIRNLYLRLIASHTQTESSISIPDDTQLWFGIRVGIH